MTLSQAAALDKTFPFVASHGDGLVREFHPLPLSVGSIIAQGSHFFNPFSLFGAKTKHILHLGRKMDADE